MANLTKLILVLFLTLSASSFHAQTASVLLKGTVDESVTKAIKGLSALYDFEGDTYYEEVSFSDDGSFYYNPSLPADEVDVMIYIGSSPYGVHLKKGTTVEMSVNNGVATFAGDNVAECKFYNKYNQAFFPMKYKGSADDPFVFANLKNVLDAEKKEVDSLLPDVNDAVRARYAGLSDSYYNAILLMLMSMDQSFNGVDHEEEINKIVAGIDPNSDEARLTGTINYWYNNSDIHIQGDNSSTLNYMVDQFEKIDNYLTNIGNKKNLWESLGSMFVMYEPSDEDMSAFLTKVEPQLAKAPLVKEKLVEAHEDYRAKVQPGDTVPFDPVLVSPEGNKCHLSELLGKNVVYIDIWATWCRPCVREIPYMEKVVEKFKGNDGITFISISRDDDMNAWLRKLDKDKPEWQQYIFEKQSGDTFMIEMGITGIPRFLLIGADGKFISPDAPRPSDENIDAILNSALK